MRIEDFWTDVHAYYVTFLTINDAEITNIILSPENYLDNDDICKIIKNKFNNVAQILLIDDLDPGLVLK
ncbi:MAG: hypothetical protein ACTIDE_06875 [Carnobacterium maltaromaticum]